MSVTYIALGSNVGDRLDYLHRGRNALAHKLNVTAVSPVYETEPVGTENPDRFLNAVLAAETNLSPEEVLSLCVAVEQECGRVRTVRNAPRTLDLDVLLYDDVCIQSPELTLPHPRMHERSFVLAPLADIAPDIVLPKLRASIQELLDRYKYQEKLVRHTGYSL